MDETYQVHAHSPLRVNYPLLLHTSIQSAFMYTYCIHIGEEIEKETQVIYFLLT